MTPELQDDLITLATNRAIEAVNSVTQLCDTGQESLKIYISVLGVMLRRISIELAAATVFDDGTKPTAEEATIRLLAMLSDALGVGAIVVSPDEANEVRKRKPPKPKGSSK